jgi:hypothetical protein
VLINDQPVGQASRLNTRRGQHMENDSADTQAAQQEKTLQLTPSLRWG